jgi:thiol-disulfide isomerase/thioredoxin
MVIRVMTFEGCPSCAAATLLVEEAVQELRLPAAIEAIYVNDEDEARRIGFLGSPSIQVDGRDIEVSRRDKKGAYACRLYSTPDGITGVPPKELLVDAIREALQK